MSDLKVSDYVVFLLEEAGFSPEQYIIKPGISSVEVHFDSAGAVEYFRKEVESCKKANSLIFEHRKFGKRHVAYIQIW